LVFFLIFTIVELQIGNGYLLSDVVNSSRRKQKVVVLRELHKAIIYTTKMSKLVTKSHVRDAVHMYPVN
jgi:hypothetical protein